MHGEKTTIASVDSNGSGACMDNGKDVRFRSGGGHVGFVVYGNVFILWSHLVAAKPKWGWVGLFSLLVSAAAFPAMQPSGSTSEILIAGNSGEDASAG